MPSDRKEGGEGVYLRREFSCLPFDRVTGRAVEGRGFTSGRSSRVCLLTGSLMSQEQRIMKSTRSNRPRIMNSFESFITLNYISPSLNMFNGPQH